MSPKRGKKFMILTAAYSSARLRESPRSERVPSLYFQILILNSGTVHCLGWRSPSSPLKAVELEFYEEYFRNANCYGELNRVFEIGNKEALRHGISVVDALHVAAANLSRCAALITTEKPTKPIFRTKIVPVVGITGAKSTQQRIYKLLGV